MFFHVEKAGIFTNEQMQQIAKSDCVLLHLEGNVAALATNSRDLLYKLL